MRHFYKAAMLVGALAVSGCANAAMGGPHRHGMDARPDVGPMAAGSRHDMQAPTMMMGMMTPLVGCHGARDDVEARLANLRATLQITPAQQSAWEVYAAAFRAHAEHMGAGMMGMMGARGASVAPPPVVERIRHHETMMSQHLASLQALRAAIEPLYASFSAEQKASADALRCEPPF